MRRVSVVWFVAMALAFSLIGTMAAPVRAATIDVNTTLDFDDNDETCSLREAIEAANINEPVGGCLAGDLEPAVDIINVPAGIYELDYTAEVGGIVIRSSVAIVGLGEDEDPAATVIDGMTEDRVFALDGGEGIISVAISNVTITGGVSDSNADGGGIYVDGDATLSLSNSVLTDNHSTGSGSGGAIFVEDGTSATITGSIIGTVLLPNTSGEDGGGIYVGEGSTLSLSSSTVTGNTADADGGGIYLDDSVVTEVEEVDVVVDETSATIENGSTISGNEAEYGGGIHVNDYATVMITSSTVSGNTASDDGDGDGGGLWVDGTATLSASHVTANGADDMGGGIYIDSDGTVNLNAASTVSGNTAFDGGGVANEGSDTLNMNGSTVSGNTAEGDGGGIWNVWDGSANIVNSTISGNEAGVDAEGVVSEAGGNGGGIYDDWCCQGDDPLRITGSTVSNNTANGGSGGGIYSANEAIITNSTVSTNTADVSGGGIFVNGSLDMAFSTVTLNTAGTGQGEGGGGVWTQVESSFVLYASIIANNPVGGDCEYNGTTFTSLGSNIDSDDSCALEHEDDLPEVDAKLDPLASNLPGTTQTHALQFESPAVDAVEPASLGLAAQVEFLLVGALPTCATAAPTDQRGEIRPKDGDEDGVAVCDIGAYELVPVPPTVSISDAPDIVEGNTGTTIEATFTVTLSRPPASTVTVAYATANGSAVANGDYLEETGVVTFPAGDRTEAVTVTVVGDGLDELNEDFVVNLSAPIGATIADGQGAGRILDDDGPAALSMNDVTVTEGNSGFVNATFTVRLLPASSSSVTVAYATANGSATTPADYESAAGTLTFAAGDTEETITVRVAGDTLVETTETFVVNLSTPTGGAIISDAQGAGTILDNDAAAGALPDTAAAAPSVPGLDLGLALVAASAVVLVTARRRAAARVR